MGGTFRSISPNLTEVPIPAFRHVIPFCHFLYNHNAITLLVPVTFKFAGKKNCVFFIILLTDSALVCNYEGWNFNTHVISGSLSPRHGASSGCGWRNGLRYGGYLRIN